METIPPKVVMLVAGALVVLAALGVYQGWQRGASDQAAVDAGLLPSSGPATGAKIASPLTEPLTPALTEAQVREIARQEARSALGRSAPSPANDSEQAAPDRGQVAVPRLQTPPPPAAAPAPTPPPAGDANQPPLF